MTHHPIIDALADLVIATRVMRSAMVDLQLDLMEKTRAEFGAIADGRAGVTLDQGLEMLRLEMLDVVTAISDLQIVLERQRERNALLDPVRRSDAKD